MPRETTSVLEKVTIQVVDPYGRLFGRFLAVETKDLRLDALTVHARSYAPRGHRYLLISSGTAHN